MMDKHTESIVEQKLHQAWRRERRYFHIRGLSRLLIWIVTMVLVDFVVDWLFIFKLSAPSQARFLLLGINAAVLLWVLYHEWLKHLKRFDPVRIALQVEKKNPELSSLLVSYVQLKEPKANQPNISGALVAAMREQALSMSETTNFRKVIDFTQLRRLLIFSSCTLFVFAMISINWSAYLHALVLRLAGVEVKYPTYTHIGHVSGNITIKQGSSVMLAARVGGRIPEKGHLYIRSPDDRAWQDLAVTPNKDNEFTRKIDEVFKDLNYYMKIGDDETKRYRVTVVPPPQIVERSVRIRYPEYMGLKDRTVDDLDVEAPEGSRLEWSLRCEPALAAVTMTSETRKPQDMEVDADGRRVKCGLTADATFKYVFHWTERAHKFEYDDVQHIVRITPDAPPEVELIRPDGNGLATVNKKLQVEGLAKDDYGLSRAWLVYTVNSGTEQRLEAGTMKGRQSVISFIWTLKETIPQIKEGDVITVAVEVSDNRRNDDAHRSRSIARRLTIVSPADYVRWFTEELTAQREELQRAREEEKSASSEIKQLKNKIPPGPEKQPDGVRK